VHFRRSVLARVPKGNAEMVAAAIRTIFAQPDAEHVHSQLDVIAGMLGRQSSRPKPYCGTPPRACWPRRLSCCAWEKIWSTDPVRHEAPHDRREVGVLPLRAVAAA
jgi:putative transposase